MTWFIAHTLIFFPVMLIILVLMVELGFLVRKASSDHSQDLQSAGESARDGLAVLMGLLLGFSLPMALPHYELQLQLVAKEADAVAVVGQRAELLPEPSRTTILTLLPQYVDARLDFGDPRWTESALSRASIEKAVERAQSLQNEMWQVAAAQARQTPNPVTVTVAQGIGALSDMIDERNAADENRIPVLIWAVLLSICSLTCFVVGYAMQHRMWLSVLALPLTAAIVLSLTSELDHPREGLVRISQSSMLRVQQEIKQMHIPAP